MKKLEGNCVDQSHICVALLRAANIPAKYEAKVVGDEGHCWHRAYINNHWRPGEATEQSGSKYGKSQWLIKNWINQEAKNGMHKEHHIYNSKFVWKDGKWVVIIEKHLKNNIWEHYYIDSFYSDISINAQNYDSLTTAEAIL